MKKREKGFTLIEIVVAVSILAILGFGVSQLFISMMQGIAYYRERTTVSSLADQYLEVARNLPYSDIGTIEGNPSGTLPDLPNALLVDFGGTDYNVYYVINLIDDPADGTIGGSGPDYDPSPNDYKQVKLYIKNAVTGAINSFLTNISPKSLEGLASGGALSIKVFDAVGQPVSGATIHITNTELEPNIDLTRLSGEEGNWIEVGLPNSVTSYHIVVTKNGYSSDQTYTATEQNPSPIKPDATISNGQVTYITFAIDKLSNLTFRTLSQTCQEMPGLGVNVKGSKLIGNPNILKFDNNYTSDSGGQIFIPNLEWDNYKTTLAGSSYMVYGSSPVLPDSVLPDTDQNFNLIIGPKTSNSLLVTVKDVATGNPIEGAQIDLQAATLPDTYTITALAGPHGSITPSGNVAVNRGSDKTFSIVADSGCSVQNVWVDGSSLGAVSSYTFNDVISDHAIFVSFAPSVSWLSDWQYRKKITISNTNVDSDLADFPVLVKILADSNMSSSLATGYDIRFTDSTGSTLLKYERESWSGGGGSPVTANFWVKVPTVSHSTATTIYIYYGNASANTDWTAQGSPTNAQLVWSSNYVAVWHLPNGTNLSAGNSTSSANSGNASNVSSTTGQIDGAANYSNANFYRVITIGSPSSVLQNLKNGDYTFESWVKPSSYVESSYIAYMNGEGLVQTKNSKYGIVHLRNVIARSSSNVMPGSFAHVVGTKNGSSYDIYINGAVSDGTFSSDNGYDNSYYAIGGGDNYQTSNEFLGVLDEVRVSSTARSVDWIKFGYHNMADSGNNLNFENQETRADTYTITALAGPHGSITPSGVISVDSLGSQTLTITPDFGYHISSLLVDENPVAVSDSYTFNNVTANHTISVSFEATIISGGYVATQYTAGSILSQQSWAGGFGQTDFINIDQYFSDDGNISNNGTPSGLRLLENGGSYVSSGSLISSTFDTGTSLTSYTNLVWQPTSQDPATSIKFQIATNNDKVTWNFIGPDGTSNTYYTTPGTAISSANNNNRYVRYKVFLSTADNSVTPVLTSVSLNYVSGCFTPGQTIFTGLQQGPGYQVVISMAGYQSQTISSITISGYNSLQVSLGH